MSNVIYQNDSLIWNDAIWSDRERKLSYPCEWLIIKWVMKVNIESDEMEFFTGGCQPGEMKDEEETWERDEDKGGNSNWWEINSKAINH